jgi:hypothetical protein
MKRTAFALLFLGMIATIAGCSDDQPKAGSEGFTVAFSPATLVGEVGGGPVSFSISVIDKATGSAAPSGSVVTILEQACLDQGQGLGFFDNQDPETATCGMISKTILTNTGSVSGSFHCANVGSAVLLAQPVADPTSGGSAQITCEEGPAGDWTIDSIEVTDGDLVSGGSAIELSATVLQGDGEPAPAGHSLTATVQSGDSLTLVGGPLVNSATNSVGVAKFRLNSTEKTGESVIRISFVDERRGPPSDRALRVRSRDDPDETQLVVTVRHEELVVTGADIVVLADGADKLNLQARVEPSPTAEFSVEGQPVTLEIIEGPGFFESDGTTEISPLTDGDGLVETEFFGGASAGTTVIEFRVVDPDPAAEGRELVEQVTVNVKALGFIEYQGIDPEVLFVRGSGQNETGTATFRVLDTDQKPLVGVPVRFTLENAPARVSNSPAMVSSDDDGYVRTTVQSGTGVGAFSITATATLGEVSIMAPSAAIPIVGAKPSRRAFQLQCEFRNVGGLRDRQGDRVVVNSQFPCTSLLLDRFGNPVGVPQTVTFASEGGNVISPQTSRRWDFRANPQSPPDDVGRVGAPYSPLGDPPCDTEPIDQEPFLAVDPEDGNCEVQLTNCPAVRSDECTFNPRDGLVTIIAVTTGEEEFSDNNSDGEYTEGEPFWDIGEPYVDTNDNNRRDAGEFFIDLAEDGEETGNGLYDGPDGAWDAQTSIWTSTHVLLTNQPQPIGLDFTDSHPYDGSNFFYVRTQDQQFEELAGNVYTMEQGSSIAVGQLWQDGFMNVQNSSCSYSAVFEGDSTGWDIDPQSAGDPLDQYGFPVEFRSDSVGENRNEYVTRIRFPESATGFGFSAVVSFDVETLNRQTGVNVRFSRNCQIAPGTGGDVTTSRIIRINQPRQ